MPTKEIVEFTRYTVPIEIRFINGLECCEWCNHSFMNMKRHFECDLTHEEMASPSVVSMLMCSDTYQKLNDSMKRLIP